MDNQDLKDITDEFFKACFELKKNEVVFHEETYRQRALYSPTANERVLKICLGLPKSSPQIDMNCDLTDCFEKDYTSTQLISIFDEIIVCLVSWLEGGSLLQSLFRCALLHDVGRVKCFLLRIFLCNVVQFIEYIMEMRESFFTLFKPRLCTNFGSLSIQNSDNLKVNKSTLKMVERTIDTTCKELHMANAMKSRFHLLSSVNYLLYLLLRMDNVEEHITVNFFASQCEKIATLIFEIMNQANFCEQEPTDKTGFYTHCFDQKLIIKHLYNVSLQRVVVGTRSESFTYLHKEFTTSHLMSLNMTTKGVLAYFTGITANVHVKRGLLSNILLLAFNIRTIRETPFYDEKIVVDLEGFRRHMDCDKVRVSYLKNVFGDQYNILMRGIYCLPIHVFVDNEVILKSLVSLMKHIDYIIDEVVSCIGDNFHGVRNIVSKIYSMLYLQLAQEYFSKGFDLEIYANHEFPFVFAVLKYFTEQLYNLMLYLDKSAECEDNIGSLNVRSYLQILNMAVKMNDSMHKFFLVLKKMKYINNPDSKYTSYFTQCKIRMKPFVSAQPNFPGICHDDYIEYEEKMLLLSTDELILQAKEAMSSAKNCLDSELRNCEPNPKLLLSIINANMVSLSLASKYQPSNKKIAICFKRYPLIPIVKFI